MNYRFLGKPPANIEHWMKTHEPTPPGPIPTPTVNGKWDILLYDENNQLIYVATTEQYEARTDVLEWSGPYSCYLQWSYSSNCWLFSYYGSAYLQLGNLPSSKHLEGQIISSSEEMYKVIADWRPDPTSSETIGGVWTDLATGMRYDICYEDKFEISRYWFNGEEWSDKILVCDYGFEVPQWSVNIPLLVTQPTIYQPINEKTLVFSVPSVFPIVEMHKFVWSAT